MKGGKSKSALLQQEEVSLCLVFSQGHFPNDVPGREGRGEIRYQVCVHCVLCLITLVIFHLLPVRQSLACLSDYTAYILLSGHEVWLAFHIITLFYNV